MYTLVNKKGTAGAVPFLLFINRTDEVRSGQIWLLQQRGCTLKLLPCRLRQHCLRDSEALFRSKYMCKVCRIRRS